MGFRGYYGKHKRKENSVVQEKCTTRKLQFRLSGDDLLLFEKHKKHYGVENESEFIRESFMDRVYKNEIKIQQFELEGIE